MTYEGRLEELGMFRLEKRRLNESSNMGTFVINRIVTNCSLATEGQEVICLVCSKEDLGWLLGKLSNYKES